MENFINKLADYGLSIEDWESVFYTIIGKKDGRLDIEWSEVVDQYEVKVKSDSIRKANDTPWGGYMVSKYYEYKNGIENVKSHQDSSIEFTLKDIELEKEVELEDEDLKKLQSSYRSETSINKDGSMTSDRLILIKEDDLKNPNTILKLHGFDTSSWELVSARNNIWNVYSKKDGINELYSSKIVTRPKTTVTFEDVKSLYLDLIKTHKSPTIEKYEVKTTGRMIEVPILDLHIGKYSTPDYVGDGNEYNLEIAKECFHEVIDTTIAELKYQNQVVKKILFPIGNDLLHIDNAFLSTTNGTPQDTNMTHQAIFKETVLLLIEGIEKLSKAFECEVKVFNVNGNHDFMSSYHALMSLWCYFHNNENVDVDLNMSSRHYERFGNCLIGFAHGDKEGKRIQGVMQGECKDWSDCKYREFHLGHLHSEQVIEINGLKIRNLPSVTATDRWHHTSAYVGALRTCQVFVWDYDKGLVGTIYVNV